MTSQLEMDFHTAMLGVHANILSLTSYNADYFRSLVRRVGGIRAAKILLRHDGITDGLLALVLADCLDSSMECLVLQSRWKSLFTDHELLMARSKLKKLGYKKLEVRMA